MEPLEKNLEKEKKFLTEFKNGEPDNETDLFVQLILRDIEKRTKYIYSSQFDLSKNPKYMFLRLNEERIKEDLQRFKNNEEFSTISKQLLKRGFQNESVWRKILSMKCEEKERIMLSIFTRQDEKRLVKAACTRELDGVFTAKEDFEFCQTVAENFLTPSSIKMNNLLIQKNNLIFLECKAFNPLKDKLNYKNRLEIFLTTVIKWLPIIYQKEGKQKAHLIFCYNGEYEEDKLSDKLLEQIDPQKTMSNKNVLELLDGFTFNIFHYDSNGLNDVFNKLSLDGLKEEFKEKEAQLKEKIPKKIIFLHQVQIDPLQKIKLKLKGSWNQKKIEYPMTQDEFDKEKFSLELELAPGKYQYWVRVNKNWIEDPFEKVVEK